MFTTDRVESTTTTFENCALYLANEFMGNIVRRDCRTVRITVGVQYAQYPNAIKVEYMPKGARNRRGFYLTYKPFLVVLSAKDAIDPASMLGAPTPGGSPGVSVAMSRYSSFDSRWESDFTVALKAKNIQPLYQVGNDYATLDQLETVA
jgi:hypothetical protein